MTDINKNTLSNPGFMQELENVEAENKVSTLKAPQTMKDLTDSELKVSDAALFGPNTLDGRLPAITQDFIVQKSKQDKLVEFGQIAQEVYKTKLITRDKIIAIESLARELTPETAQESASESRKVIVSDHEVNMFTEEPSGVEVDTAINGTQVTIDRVTTDIRNNAIALAEQLIATAETDAIERNEKLTKSIALFTKAICTFLKETQSSALENANVRFKRDLDWGNLMGIPVNSLVYTNDTYYKELLSSFESTNCSQFIKELSILVADNKTTNWVIQNFVIGKLGIINNAKQAYDNINEVNDGKLSTFTIGDLFKSFGSVKFTAFYYNLCEIYDMQLNAARSTKKLLAGEESLEKLTFLSSELQKQHSTMMAVNFNLSTMNAVQYLVICLLNKF